MDPYLGVSLLGTVDITEKLMAKLKLRGEKVGDFEGGD